MDSVMSFDATVVNGDRKKRNPNLLWDGNEKVDLIDHGMACPAHSWPDEEIAQSPLFPDYLVRVHSSFDFIEGRGCTFDQLHATWLRRMGPSWWPELRALIPPEWERRPGDLDRMFRFLGDRSNKLTDVAAALRSVVR